MQALRAEVDTAVDRAEAAEARIKVLEQELLQKEQENSSLTHKVSLLETDLDKSEGKVADLKTAQANGELDKTTNDSLVRKIQLLEEELDAAEKNVKETVEKYVPHLPPDRTNTKRDILSFKAETSGREGRAL